MKKFNKVIVLVVAIAMFFCNAASIAFANDDIATTHFLVIVKAEYWDKAESIITGIDCEYITSVRELTNPSDYDEPYTPMLLVWVNNDEDSFEKAQKYFLDKEYFLEIRYDVLIGGDETDIPGDTDKDGFITAKDARFALRCSVGLEEYTDEVLKAMDMDSDNSVTASDARCILRLSVGLPM